VARPARLRSSSYGALGPQPSTFALRATADRSLEVVWQRERAQRVSHAIGAGPGVPASERVGGPAAFAP
jgi:hypothetical protein